MLSGVLCSARRLFTPLSFVHRGGATHQHRLFIGSPAKLGVVAATPALRFDCSGGGGASISHAIIPASRSHFYKPAFHHGEGSWNVAWDARPARWLHRPDSAWFLFGVCACLATPLEFFDLAAEQPVPAVNVAVSDKIEGTCSENVISNANLKNSANYRMITGKPPMGLTHTVKKAVDQGTLSDMLDPSVPDWPLEEALCLTKLALQCSELRRKVRPDLGKVVLPELNRLGELAEDNMIPFMMISHSTHSSVNSLDGKSETSVVNSEHSSKGPSSSSSLTDKPSGPSD